MSDQIQSTSSLIPGARVGRYHLVECIGEGGMGAVWRARDDKLDRDVAIKFLLDRMLVDESAHERFRREALALSRINHAGVATVFDFESTAEQDFLVMEHVTGGTLEEQLAAGPMSFDDIAKIGGDIAAAVQAAHEQGVLHRDLKPGNVMLTASGDPKILDFGLAVLLTGRGATRVTQAGAVVGSVPYMAPEQIFGEADDVRTDVYALGVLLFEMSTGTRPFEKDRLEALMFSIINDAPPDVRTLRPDVPDDLDRLIGWCLQKEPGHRPKSAAAVREALAGLVTSPAAPDAGPSAHAVVRSIAVLPFRNVSQDPTGEFFSDGMTEAVIMDLARVKELRVISRTSVMQYKNTELSLPQIARELNVDAILEGSVLLVDGQVRLTVQLVGARRDETMWADRFDRSLENILTLQSELAETVTNEIQIQLSPEERHQLTDRPEVNPDAHLELLQSRHYLFSGSPEAVVIGVKHAQRALDLEADYAPAWSALADCYIWQAIRGSAPPGEVVPKAIEAAERALQLDDTLADAHTSLGLIQCHSSQLPAGLKSLRRAIALNPNHALAHNMLSRALYSYEEHTTAIYHAHKSASLDPLSMMIQTGVGDAYYFARQYEMAVLHYRKSIELDPRFDGAHTDLARALEALGEFDESRAAYEEGRRLAGGVAGPSFGLAHLEAAAGNEDEARRILHELTTARGERVVSAWGIAALHASLGDVDEAFQWLDTAFDEKASGLILLRVHPRLDPIRDDPRYPPLVQRAGLDVVPE